MALNVNVIDQNKKLEVAEAVFGAKVNESLIHQVVTAYLAAARSGTAAQKTRAEVSGGGKKPWKQKGTGNARAGTSRGPIWRGGGVTFASKTRDYSQKVNKKMYKGAMRAIFAELLGADRLVVVNELKLQSNKTKDFVKQLTDMNLKDVLIVTDEVENQLYLAARNLPDVQVVDVQGINPVNLLQYDKVMITVAALHKVEEMFK